MSDRTMGERGERGNDEPVRAFQYVERSSSAPPSRGCSPSHAPSLLLPLPVLARLDNHRVLLFQLDVALLLRREVASGFDETSAVP